MTNCVRRRWIPIITVPLLSMLSSCSFFIPSAWENVPFEAGIKGATAEVSFTALLTKNYVFYLDLHYKAGDRIDQERVSYLVDSWGHWPDGQPARRGPPLPVHLTVTRVNGGASRASSVILDRTFTQHRLEGHGFDFYSDVITFAHLEPGRYRARIEALEDLPALHDVSVRFDVHVPGHPS